MENKNELVEQFKELLKDLSFDELEDVQNYIKNLLNKD